MNCRSPNLLRADALSRGGSSRSLFLPTDEAKENPEHPFAATRTGLPKNSRKLRRLPSTKGNIYTKQELLARREVWRPRRKPGGEASRTLEEDARGRQLLQRHYGGPSSMSSPNCWEPTLRADINAMPEGATEFIEGNRQEVARFAA